MIRLRAMTRKECCKKYDKWCNDFDDAVCWLSIKKVIDGENCRICQNKPAKVKGKYIMVRCDK